MPSFWNEGIHIERRGMRQFQRDKLLGMEEEIEVSWPTPCEYILHGEDSLSTRYVKIVGVDDKGYDCLVYSSPKGSTGYTIRLERVR